MLQQRLTRNLYTGQTEPLTAPLSFDFTEDLGDKRNLSLLSQYGGAAAAYSLRALGSYNENVVRVRRASDNDEKDFTASQVSSGELTNWVNSQTVPPLDIGVETSEGRIPVPEGGTSIGTPAAAYSLRNLSTTYTGNVVDVRRSSDNAVASFTAAEVADGTLEAWVNTDVVKFNPSNTTASGWYVGANISFVAGDDYMQFTGAGVRTTAGNMLGTSAVRNTDGSYSITFDAKYVSGGSLLLGEDYGGADILSVSPASNGGEWASYTVSVNPWNGISTSFTINRRIIFTTSSGSVWQLRNVEVSQVEADGFVSKWYDQSGNDNHATQGTAASQPKIVDGGVLVRGNTGEPAFTGDGVDDILSLSSSINFGTGEFFVSTVVDVDTGGVVIGSASPNWMLLVTTSSIQVRASNTNVIYIISPDSVLTAGESYLISLSRVGNDITAYVNGVAQADVETVVSTDTFSADRFLQRGTNGNPYPDPVSEVIIYNSDQSANRTAIEANIGETYGITGIPAYDNTVDGFVETWYDQSGNGNDATQSVAASQPKIVNAGVFLGEVDFLDGVNTFLETTNSDLCNVDELSVFSVLKPFIAQSQAVAFSCGSVVLNSSAYGGWRLNFNGYLNKAEFQTQAIGNSSGSTVSNDVGGSYTLLSYVADFPDASTFANGQAGLTSTNNISPNNNDSLRRRFRIGCQFTFTRAGFYPEPIKEIILYTSDQSSNRVAIETNINDHYNIY
jgi:hypothetical protein